MQPIIRIALCTILWIASATIAFGQEAHRWCCA